jgi:hypothetical protein
VSGRVNVIVGDSHTTATRKVARVHAHTLRGLALVYAPAECDVGPDGPQLTLVHKASGLALLKQLLAAPEAVQVVRALIGPDWTISAEAISLSAIHAAAVGAAEQELRTMRARNPRSMRGGPMTARQSASVRERKIALELGADLVPGSGSTPGNPRDFSTGEFLYEHKHKLSLDGPRPHHVVNGKDLDLIFRQAVRTNRTPIYIFEFGTIATVFLPFDSFCFDEVPGEAIDLLLRVAPKNSWRLTIDMCESLRETRFVKVPSESRHTADKEMRVPTRMLDLRICGMRWLGMGYNFYLRQAKKYIAL